MSQNERYKINLENFFKTYFENSEENGVYSIKQVQDPVNYIKRNFLDDSYSNLETNNFTQENINNSITHLNNLFTYKYSEKQDLPENIDQEKFNLFLLTINKFCSQLYKRDLELNNNQNSKEMTAFLETLKNNNKIKSAFRQSMDDFFNKDPHQLNELFYRAYISWAKNDKDKNSYIGFCQWLDQRFDECIYLHKIGVITNKESNKIIASLKRLQLNAAHEQASNLETNKAFLQGGTAGTQIGGRISEFTGTRKADSNRLIDYQTSRIKKALTSTRKSLNMIIATYTNYSKDSSEVKRIDAIFGAAKYGTIANIKQAVKIETIYKIDHSTLKNNNQNDLKEIFKNALKTSVTLNPNLTPLKKAQLCADLLNQLYQYVIDSHLNGKISGKIESDAIKALKSLQCDVVLTLVKNASIFRLDFSNKPAIVEEIENTSLAKHHRSKSSQLFLSHKKTSTQNEINKIAHPLYDASTGASNTYNGTASALDFIVDAQVSRDLRPSN